MNKCGSLGTRLNLPLFTSNGSEHSRRRKTKQCHLEGKKSRHCREAMAIAAVPVPMKHQSSLVGGFLTILKNISQWEGLSHILWKIKNV